MRLCLCVPNGPSCVHTCPMDVHMRVLCVHMFSQCCVLLGHVHECVCVEGAPWVLDSRVQGVRWRRAECSRGADWCGEAAHSRRGPRALSSSRLEPGPHLGQS